MDMNEMLQITRLVQRGGLTEATTLIQRALRGVSVSDNAAEEADIPKESVVLDGVFRVIQDDTDVKDGNAQNASAAFRRSPSPQWQEYIEQFVRPAPSPETAAKTAPGGRFITGSYSNHAGTRAYKLYIPSSYHGQPFPMVVMLHGCTQNPDDFAAGTRMNNLAEEHSCFVVYPAQAQNANGQKCWNWFKAGDQQREQGEPSLIAGITRQVMNAYSVDSRRVYVAGLSAGGAMATVMGATYPDLYAAIGVHSGLPFAVAHDLPSALAAMHGGGRAAPPTTAGGQGKGAVPLIVLHGDKDTTVHPRNSDEIIAQWISTQTHGRVGRKPRVTVQQGRASGGHEYSRAIYHDTNDQSVMEQWRIHGAGHAWSGGSSSGSYTDPRGPDAGREMIRFFYEHPRESQ
ncbi:MAG TPA: PHB depolymerase family esterase [Burkholderiales bacterium]|nr:PHB depolymerase family esterase [Burkholderiales bacterium]